MGRNRVQRYQSDGAVLRRLGGLMLLFALVALAAGASRMRPMAWELQSFGDVLRIREALSMFVFAPAIAVIFWLLLQTFRRGEGGGVVDILMVLAIYAVACGMGIHDPANRLVSAYGTAGKAAPELMRSIVWLDDGLGHWVFWAGFVLGTWVMGLQQLKAPLQQGMGWWWRVFFLVITGAMLWVMLTNLWDEYPKTLDDLCVIGGAAGVPLVVHLIWYRGVGLWRLPLLLMIYPAYLGSIVGTVGYWWVKGVW